MLLAAGCSRTPVTRIAHVPIGTANGCREKSELDLTTTPDTWPAKEAQPSTDRSEMTEAQDYGVDGWEDSLGEGLGTPSPSLSTTPGDFARRPES